MMIQNEFLSSRNLESEVFDHILRLLGLINDKYSTRTAFAMHEASYISTETYHEIQNADKLD